MKLSSTAFDNGACIPAQFTCDSKNVNPPLDFSEVPRNTVSLALIVDDPDAPAKVWTHWLLWNIRPDLRRIEENSVPFGATQGTTDFKKAEWGGPCPPSGMHRYLFKLYALNIALELPSTVNKKDLEGAMEGHILERAELLGVYQRQA